MTNPKPQSEKVEPSKQEAAVDNSDSSKTASAPSERRSASQTQDGFARDAEKDKGKIIINRVSDIDKKKLLEDPTYVEQFSNTQRPNIAKIITACEEWIDNVEGLDSFQDIKPNGYYEKDELAILRGIIEGELQKSVLGRIVYEKIFYEQIDVTSGFRFVEMYITLTYIEEMELQKKDGDPDIIENMGISHWKTVQHIAEYIQEFHESYSLQQDLKRQGGPVLQIIKQNNPQVYDMVVSFQTLLEKFFEMHRVQSGGGRQMKQKQTKGMLKHMQAVKAQVQTMVAQQQAANAQTNVADMSAEQTNRNQLKH